MRLEHGQNSLPPQSSDASEVMPTDKCCQTRSPSHFDHGSHPIGFEPSARAVSVTSTLAAMVFALPQVAVAPPLTSCSPKVRVHTP